MLRVHSVGKIHCKCVRQFVGVRFLIAEYADGFGLDGARGGWGVRGGDGMQAKRGGAAWMGRGW